MAPPVHPDTAAPRRDSLMNAVLASIQGKEQAPAESVFKNIQALKGRPAAQVVRVMNIGFGRSLGVGCDHCHVIGDWANEEKPQMQITRDMMAMVNRINTELLPQVKNLRSPNPTVACTTCHRGDVRPATVLSAPTSP